MCETSFHKFDNITKSEEDPCLLTNEQLKSFNGIYFQSIRSLEKLLKDQKAWSKVVDIFEDEFKN